MTVETETQRSPQPDGEQQPTTVDIIDQLSQFDGPPDQFLVALLSAQCRVSGASAGAILRAAAGGRIEVLAFVPPAPPDSPAPVWLAQSAESAGNVLATGRTEIRPLRSPAELYGQPSQRHLVLIPLRGKRDVHGAAGFLVESGDPDRVRACRERLELTVSLLSLYEMRLTVQRRQLDLRRLQLAMETLAAVNEQARFAGAAMALCNEVASRWQADRVGLGLLKGRYVQARALSHTEKFSRKMKLVQDLESAMEECLDQDVEVVAPPPAEASFVSRAATELSRRHGPTAVLSLPLRRTSAKSGEPAGQPVGVLTVERAPDRPFAAEEIEALRLTCDLCVPRIVGLSETDRWFGAKWAAGLRSGLGVMVGAKHTWAKLAAAGVLAAALFAWLGRGDYQAEAPFVLEAAAKQEVSAPFESSLKSVSAIRPGDPVTEGQELAALHTWDLDLQLGEATAERNVYVNRKNTASRDGKTAEEQIADAEIKRVEARIELLNKRIAQGRIVSPISGRLLSGEWDQAIGKPVKAGDQLFEVASSDVLRAELSVPEDRMAEVTAAFDRARAQGRQLDGELATAGSPERKIGFVIERINPVAEVVNDKNVFKVRVRLTDNSSGFRPGMEGVAKISLGRARYAWLWSRPAINWLRMKLWM